MAKTTYFCNFHCNGTSWARPMSYTSKRAAIASVKATAAGEADLSGAKCSVSVWYTKTYANGYAEPVYVYCAARRARGKKFEKIDC